MASLTDIYNTLITGVQSLNALNQTFQKVLSIPSGSNFAPNTVFGAAGASHAPGLVPDPGASSHFIPYYLGDDAAFHSLGSSIAFGSLYVSSFGIGETAVGSAGQVLTWTSSLAAPSPQTPATPASPNFVLLQTTTLSPSNANLTIPLSSLSAYSTFKLFCDGLIPNVTGGVLALLVSSNNGTSFDSANYQNLGWAINQSAGTATFTSSTYMRLSDNEVSTAAGLGENAEITLFNVNNGGLAFGITAHAVYFQGATSNLETITMGGYYDVGNINAVQLVFTSGAFNSGTVRLYGLT